MDHLPLESLADQTSRHSPASYDAVANSILASIGPKRVLVLGGAIGFLVGALRNRGVEAIALDLCRSAIDSLPPSIWAYSRPASTQKDLDEQYDLVICVGFVEVLSEAEGRRLIAQICRSTGDVLFSSTPDDLGDPSHLTVRPRSFWIQCFTEHSFYLDVAFEASFLGPYAMRFRWGEGDDSTLDTLLAHRDLLQSQLA